MISSLDLAKICGVSQGTVDRAIHGRPGIAEATRTKIMEAAKLHNYSPNPVARELMTGRNTLVGAIIPAGASVFFMDLVEELRKALQKEGLRLIISPASNEEEALDAIRELCARRMRGIAVIPPSDDFVIPDEISKSTNVVALASPCCGKGVRYIAPDESRTGFDGAEWLWSLGHRKIAFFSYARKARAIIERRDGYSKFMRKKGATFQCFVPSDDESIMAVMRDSAPTAIFCHNDWLALSTMRVLEAHGIRVPEDVSVLGVDDSPTFCSLFPGLATLAYPYAQIANFAAKVLSGKKISQPAMVFDRFEIKKRKSVRRICQPSDCT